MDYDLLIKACVEGLTGFDVHTQAADLRLEELLANNQLDDAEETFVVEVFSGCVRYHALLEVTVGKFYLDEGKKMLRKDCILYKIFSYISMLRLNDLGFENFKSFVQSQDTNKMYRFLKYLFDPPKLQSWLKVEWCHIYDQKFIEDTVLPNLLDNMTESHTLISQLSDKLQNKSPAKKPTAYTKPVPFELTKVKPRGVPMPEEVPKLPVTNPVPKTTYVSPREETKLMQIKEDNRKKSQKLLDNVQNISKNHTKTEKSSKTQQRLNTILQDEEAQLKFDCHKARPVPKSVTKNNSEIKLNAASILREDALYAKREEQEVKKIVGVLSGEGTDEDFQIWQQMRDEAIKREEAEKQARKHMIGLISYEEAMLAKQRLTEANKQKVVRMKIEADKMLQEYLLAQLRDEEETREKVLTIQESHQQAKIAQTKLQDVKRKLVQEVHAESKMLMQIAVEEAEKEMERKMKLIQEIRAFDRTPISTQKFVDLTATAGFGFLCEMSIAELRERIVLIKEEAEKELEDKRGDILAEKVSYKKMIENKLDAISHHREMISKESEVKSKEKEKMKSPPQIKSEEIDSLQKKLEEKRAERMKMKSMTQTAFQSLPVKRVVNLEAEKRAMEERRWKELEHTRERMAKLNAKTITKSLLV